MTTPSQVAPVIDWIIDGARSAALPQEIVRQLCERLLDCGLPLLRVGVFVRTLHPVVAGRGYVWQRGVAAIQLIDAVYDDLQSDQYLKNPLYPVFNGAGEIRRRLDRGGPDEFLVFAELRALGATDYLIMPLEFTTGEIHAVSFTTDRPGGFADGELDGLRRVARNILNAYLGAQPGERVLNGQIKRGDGDEIHAVIWFSDLRDSTRMADAMTRRDFLGVLNEFFECTAGAVLARGDAVLAIFPVSAARSSAAQACASAVAAANEAARIEGLCRTLGCSLLVSEAVARQCAGEWRSLGRHALRGVGEPIELFTGYDAARP